ncbi:SHOCT domain-containing protein [Paraconexibacter sp.]|uniref:SHOCT domain-containing protein n=1 Tax=Paraconexibacter sp. TaxID=2949640 RepID=UPI00356B0B68
MGLRDLFGRRKDEQTTIGGLPGVPGGLGSAPPSEAVVRPASSVHVQSTTVGADGVPQTTTYDGSGRDVLAHLPPQARAQLEALGLDRLIADAASGGFATFDPSAMVRAFTEGTVTPGTPDQIGAPGTPSEDPIEKLRRLAELRDEGIVTPEEFAEQKARLLGEL